MLVTLFYFAVERNARKYYFLKRLDTNRSSNNELKRNNNDSNFRESNRSRYLPFVVFNSDDRVGESKQLKTRHAQKQADCVENSREGGLLI